MHAEVRKLNDIRMELDLSFQEVAYGMTAIGYPLTMRALHKLVNEDVRPHPRTLFKIRKYLAHVRRAAQGEVALTSTIRAAADGARL